MMQKYGNTLGGLQSEHEWLLGHSDHPHVCARPLRRAARQFSGWTWHVGLLGISRTRPCGRVGARLDAPPPHGLNLLILQPGPQGTASQPTSACTRPAPTTQDPPPTVSLSPASITQAKANSTPPARCTRHPFVQAPAQRLAPPPGPCRFLHISNPSPPGQKLGSNATRPCAHPALEASPLGHLLPCQQCWATFQAAHLPAQGDL